MRRRGAEPELPFRQLGDPLYSQRNPHQFFLLGLSVLAAIGLIEGSTGSVVLDEAMHPSAVIAWGWMLLLGSTVGLTGMWWMRTWTGLLIERGGLAVVAGAALIYAVLVWRAVPDARYSAFIHIAYGLSCGWRVWQISDRLKWVRAQVRRLNLEGS